MRLVVFAALCLAASPASAAERSVESRPRDVTVFPSGARIERFGEVRCPAGSVTLRFADIPAAAQEGSLRLSLAGPKGTKLFGIQFSTAQAVETVEKRTKELQDQIRALDDQKQDIADRIAGRNQELEILRSLAKESAQRTSEKAAGLGEVASGTAAIGRRIAEIVGANRKDERAQRPLDERANALRRELSQVGGGARQRRTAEAEVELAEEGNVRATLSYLVSGASWSPVYDAKLEADGKPKVSLSFGAQVRQNTGEDWSGVKMTLSTARPTEGTQVPDPGNWWLDFAHRRPRPMRAASKSMSRRAEQPAMEAMAPASAPAAGGEVYEDAAVDEAETVRAEYATGFEISRKVDVPSDGSSHRVAVAESSHAAELFLVAVPRLAQAAFVEAKVAYEGDQPLLPGTVHLFRGGEFSGTAPLSAVAPGESFTLGFGQDENVKVERKRVKDVSAGAGLLSKARRTYRWVTTVKSFHTGKRTIEVREQLPQSRQKDIVVELAEASPAPQAADPDKPGLHRFRLDLDPKGTAKVTFAYTVRWPDNTEVSGLE